MGKYDDILINQIKPVGRWQWQMYIIFMTGSIPFSLIYFHMFTSLRPEHFCRPKGYGVINNWTKTEWRNLTAPQLNHQSFDSCRSYILPTSVNVTLSFEEARREMDMLISSSNMSTEECSNGWIYMNENAVYPYTTVESFNLVCSRRGLTLASSTAFLFGFIAGALSFGEVGDRYGRRKTGILALIFGFFSSILTATAPVFLIYVLGRFLTGMFVQGHVVVMYTLVMENSGPAARDVFSVLFSFLIAVCFLLLYTVLAYIIPNWRWLLIALSSPMLIVVIYFPFMPESPRWLLGQGRHSEALEIINKAIRTNNPNSPSSMTLENISNRDQLKRSSNEDVHEKAEMAKGNYESQPLVQTTFTALVRGHNMRRITLLMTMLWFYHALSYYGASFYSVKMRGVNPYLAVSAPSLVKVVALCIHLYLVRRLKRRIYMFGLQLSGSVCLIIVACLYLLPESKARDITAMVFMSLLLGSVVTGFCLCYVYSSELFPTQLRSRGIGICSTLGRVGAALAPLVVDLDRVVGIHALPMAVCGAVGLFATAVGWFLPETKGRPLMETAAEVEEITTNKIRKPDDNVIGEDDARV